MKNVPVLIAFFAGCLAGYFLHPRTGRYQAVGSDGVFRTIDTQTGQFVQQHSSSYIWIPPNPTNAISETLTLDQAKQLVSTN